MVVRQVKGAGTALIGAHRAVVRIVMTRRTLRLAAMLCAMAVVNACALWPGPIHLNGLTANYPHTAVVQPGDSYKILARRHNVHVDELIATNKGQPPFVIHPGQVLLLPRPMTHTVGYKETLTAVSRRYQVDPDRLARLNDMGASVYLVPGTVLRIPDGRIATAIPVAKETAANYIPPSWRRTPAAKPGAAPNRKTALRPKPPARYRVTPPKRTPAQKASFRPRMKLSWPVRGKILSGYGSKGKGSFNDGINIEADHGTPVRAAAAGTVIYRGSAVPGFGKLILIRHNNDLVTAYAHLGRFGASEGDRVASGEMIGWVGTTGSVTEPQLHFEVREGVRPIDPMPFLKGS